MNDTASYISTIRNGLSIYAAMLNNGFIYEFKDVMNYVSPSTIQIPKTSSFVLITYSKCGRKNLGVAEVVNEQILAKNLAKYLSIDLSMAKVIVLDYVDSCIRFRQDITLNSKTIILSNRGIIEY